MVAAGFGLVLLAVVVHALVPVRWRTAVWTMVVLAAVVPWFTWTEHSHWNRVQWIPFVSPPIRAGDITQNLLLYLPLGYFFVRGGGTRRVLGAIGYALLLSVATELTQVYSHGRFPSSTDVTVNTAGAWLGAMASHYIGRRGPATPQDPA